MVNFVEWLWSLFERGLSMAFVGPVWTGLLEIMTGFWEGINKCLGTLLDHVSQSIIDDVYRTGVCVIVLLICVVVIRCQNALEYAIISPIRVIAAGISTVIAWSTKSCPITLLSDPITVYDAPVIMSASPPELLAPLGHHPVNGNCLRKTSKGTSCLRPTLDQQPCWQHK